jgi:hypothetical protein
VGGWRVGLRPHSSRARLQHGNSNAHDGKLAIEVHHVKFPTPSSTPTEATIHRESGGETLFDPILFTITPSHPAVPLPSPKPGLHGNVDLVRALECTRIILAPGHRASARARAEQNALEKREAVVFAVRVLVFISTCGDDVRNKLFNSKARQGLC